MVDEKTIKNLESVLKIHAKALGIPAGSAEVFIKKSLNSAKTSLKKHKVVKNSDLNRAVYKELEKYHPDLAYVFKNYDKII